MDWRLKQLITETNNNELKESLKVIEEMIENWGISKTIEKIEQLIKLKEPTITTDSALIKMFSLLYIIDFWIVSNIKNYFDNLEKKKDNTFLIKKIKLFIDMF